jgi:hypothetical protein
MEEQNFDILGFSAIFTNKFPFGKPGYVHYYFERSILHHPELSRQMYVQYGKYVRKVGWYIWNFIFLQNSSIKLCSTFISKSFLSPTKYFGIFYSLLLFSFNNSIKSLIVLKAYLSLILRINKITSTFLKYDFVKDLCFSCPAVSINFI